MGWLRWWLFWRWRSQRLYDEVAEVLRYDASLPVRPWRCKFCQYRVIIAQDHSPACRLYPPWR